jgi:hypothetical protein
LLDFLFAGLISGGVLRLGPCCYWHLRIVACDVFSMCLALRADSQAKLTLASVLHKEKNNFFRLNACKTVKRV